MNNRTIIMIAMVAVVMLMGTASASDDIAINNAKITSANTVLVTFDDPGAELTSVTAAKWHIDTTDGGTDPLTPSSAEVTAAGTPWTVTLTFAADSFSDTATAYTEALGLYVEALGVSDGTDTNAVVAHDASKVITDGQVPTVALTYSANPAKVGAMTVTATYSEAIVGTPAISIDQQGTTDITAAAMTDSGDQTVWTYAYTVVVADAGAYVDGVATVSLSVVADAATNNAAAPTGTTFTTDTTAPTDPTPVTIASDNAVPTLAKSGDTVTITTTVEALSTLAGTIGDKAATGSVDGTTGTLTRVMDGTETAGVLAFSFVSTDQAGNAGSAITAVTDATSVTADFIAPTLSSAARVDDTQINVTMSEAVTALDTGSDGGFIVTETDGSATYAVSAIAVGGSAEFVVLTVEDMAASGAAGVNVTYNATDANGTINDTAGNALATDDTIGVTVAAWETTAVSTGGHGGGSGTYPPGWLGTPTVTATKAPAATTTATAAPPDDKATPAPTKKPAVTKATAPTAEGTTAETAKNGAPGFTAIFAIAGLLAIAYAMMRRRE